MKKVKLTQEQAKAIERYPNKDDLMKAKLIGLLEHGKDESIAELSNKELACALYIGYEVEPEFKVGDWVVWRSTEGVDVIKQIEKVEGYKIWADWLDKGNLLFASSDEIRHATPDEIAEEKERRWWEKHGRDVWELKQGDILMGIHRALYEVTADPKSHRFGYYTGNDSRDFEIGECKRDGWRVVCFAESRLDQ